MDHLLVSVNSGNKVTYLSKLTGKYPILSIYSYVLLVDPPNTKLNEQEVIQDIGMSSSFLFIPISQHTIPHTYMRLNNCWLRRIILYFFA